MSDIADPHDRFFKEMMSRRETAEDYLRHTLPPKVVGLFDLETLSITTDSFIDSELRAHLSDVVYRIRLKEGGDAWVYLLFEHKSYPDPGVGLQLLRYITRLWEQVLKNEKNKKGKGFPLPPVIPLVFYQGEERWSIATEFSALFECPLALRPYVPEFRYLLTDLSRYSDDEIRTGAFLQMGLLLMRHIFDEDLPRHLPRILSTMRQVASSRQGLDALQAALRYVATASGTVDAEDLREIVAGALLNDGEKIMSTLAERWIEEGKQKGLEEGLEKGLQKGLEKGLQKGLEKGLQKGLQKGSAAATREAVAEALEARFEVVTRSILGRLESIDDLSVLKTLLRKAVTTASLDMFRQEMDAILS